MKFTQEEKISALVSRMGIFGDGQISPSELAKILLEIIESIESMPKDNQ